MYGRSVRQKVLQSEHKTADTFYIHLLHKNGFTFKKVFIILSFA